MKNIYQADPQTLIGELAEALKKNEKIKAPQWAMFAKTGMHKQRPPAQTDWWQTRCAAILRTVALQGPIGTNKLVVKYGGRKNRGHKKDKFFPGSGSVARKALQQLEAAGLIKQGLIVNRKGRIMTPEGEKFINSVIKQMGGAQDGKK